MTRTPYQPRSTVGKVRRCARAGARAGAGDAPRASRSGPPPDLAAHSRGTLPAAFRARPMEHVDNQTTDPYVKWWNVAALLRVSRGTSTSPDPDFPDALDSSEEDLTGSTLSGKYLLVRKRGVGGMGNVY